MENSRNYHVNDTKGDPPIRPGRVPVPESEPPNTNHAPAMNTPGEATHSSACPPVSLRPEKPGDAGFLFDVFASTREEELALTNWDEPMRRAFLKQQFDAMRRGYRSMFPAGDFSIVEVGGQPAGRMVIGCGAAEIRVVDLALLPAQRNRGVGTLLMRRVCATAADVNKPVRLCVLKNNRAGRWYERLGFVKTGEQGCYDELEWRPGVSPASPAG